MSPKMIIAGETPGSGTRRLVHLCLSLAIVAAAVAGVGRLVDADPLMRFTAKLIGMVNLGGLMELKSVT